MLEMPFYSCPSGGDPSFLFLDFALLQLTKRDLAGGAHCTSMQEPEGSARSLFQRDFVFLCQDNPEYASQAGQHDHDARLQDLSPAAFEARGRHCQVTSMMQTSLWCNTTEAAHAQSPVAVDVGRGRAAHRRAEERGPPGRAHSAAPPGAVQEERGRRARGTFSEMPPVPGQQYRCPPPLLCVLAHTHV